jgi:hypothetical protein
MLQAALVSTLHRTAPNYATPMMTLFDVGLRLAKIDG